MKKMLEKSQRYLMISSELAAKATEVLVVPLTLGFCLIVFAGVVTRFIFKVSFTTSMEFSRILFVWFCFLGSSLAYKRNQHIQFTFILKKVSEKVRGIMNLCIDTVSLLFFAVLLFESIKLVKKVSMTVFPASGLSYTVMYISFPIASTFFIIHALNFLCGDACKILNKEAE